MTDHMHIQTCDSATRRPDRIAAPGVVPPIPATRQAVTQGHGAAVKEKHDQA